MYSFKNYSLPILSLVAASAAVSNFAYADDAAAQKGFDEAKAAYALRSFVSKDESAKQVEKALALLADVEGKADSSDLNYDILVLESRALYWKGEHSDSVADRLSIHSLGEEKGKAAASIDDSYAEGYYFAGINLARWGEAKGVAASLFRKNDLIKYMQDSMKRLSRDSQPGESVDGFGPDRVLGRLYFKLPSVFGGSHTGSVSYLTKAVEGAANLPLNTVYLAETLSQGSAAEKTQAKQILTQLLTQDPAKMDPNRLPEAVEEFQEAKDLLAKIH